MTVEDPEAPRGEHQQRRARKQDLHQDDGELPFVAVESRGNQVDEPRGGPHAERNEHRGDDEQQPEDRFGKLRGLFVAPLGVEPCIDGDEGGRENAFAEEILEEVGNPEGGAEGVGSVGVSKVVREDPVTDEADQPAEEDSGGNRSGVGASL